jgi:hypothetical protein
VSGDQGARDHLPEDGGTIARARHQNDRRGRDAVVVARAVLRHPELWWASLGAVRRLARPGWWRHAPFLPVPGDAYWQFRLVTANGGDGEGDMLARSDVVAYLRWCQKSRPGRG